MLVIFPFSVSLYFLSKSFVTREIYDLQEAKGSQQRRKPTPAFIISLFILYFPPSSSESSYTVHGQNTTGNFIRITLYFPYRFYHLSCDAQSVSGIRDNCNQSGVTFYTNSSIPRRRPQVSCCLYIHMQ